MRFLQHCLEYIRSYVQPLDQGPVKRLFSFGVLIAAVTGLLLAGVTSSQSSTLILQPSRDVVIVGETFYIDVYVDAKTAINAVEVEISYPEHLLSIDSLRQGESVLTIWTEEPHVRGGRIYLSGGTFRRGFTGKHRIISVAAQATSAGIIRISPESIRFLAGDGTGEQVPLSLARSKAIQMYAFTSQEAASADNSRVIEGDREERRLTDLTGDGRVTMQDISIFMAAWSSGSPVYDFTGDGRMTFRDFSIILADFFLRR